MARVSLILPIAQGTTLPGERIHPYRDALEALGVSVEVVVSEANGLAPAAVEGMRRASGDALLVLDPWRGYPADCLAGMVLPLLEGEAEVTVAAPARGLTARVGMLGRPLLGSSAALSGLIGLTREAALESDHALAPVGSRFALEVLAKVRGRRLDRPVVNMAGGRRQGPGLSDLKHLKRLADDRFGTLSRLFQFCMVGASGMVVDLTSYAVLQTIFSHSPLAGLRIPLVGQRLDLAAAGGLAIGLALVWNFLLNRRLTFNYARGGSFIKQLLTYALGNALGIALSFTLRLYLPSRIGFFERHRLAAAVVGIVVATGISFSMSRWVVFRRRPAPAAPSPCPHKSRMTHLGTSSSVTTCSGASR